MWITVLTYGEAEWQLLFFLPPFMALPNFFFSLVVAIETSFSCQFVWLSHIWREKDIYFLLHLSVILTPHTHLSLSLTHVTPIFSSFIFILLNFHCLFNITLTLDNFLSLFFDVFLIFSYKYWVCNFIATQNTESH